MAAPMRESALDGGHRTKVADPRTAAATNFEYDDNEWDIGIGDLIIDLDADIEKTNEKAGGPAGGGQMAQAAGKAKMAVEHSATVQDKGLKMKIKRTKPGTKTSEAKHEIVKPGEQNGAEAGSENKGKHPQGPNVTKRLSGGHRKDKAREKHCGEKALTKPSGTAMVEASVNSVSVNGVVRPGVTTATTSTTVNSPTAPSQTAQQPRPVFPASQGPGPPSNPVPNTPGPPSVVPVPKLDPPKLVAATPAPSSTSGSEERSSSVSPPPTKRIKTTTPEAKVNSCTKKNGRSRCIVTCFWVCRSTLASLFLMVTEVDISNLSCILNDFSRLLLVVINAGKLHRVNFSFTSSSLVAL